MNKKVLLGLILIIFGLIIFLGNLDFLEGDFTLVLISAGFYFAYFLSGNNNQKRNIGFLIPANIIFMLGIFTILENNRQLERLSGTLFFVFMGTAFLLVYLIHTSRLQGQTSGERNWPLITAGAIYLFSGFIFAVEYLEAEVVARILGTYWPVILIIIGVIIIIRNLKKSNPGD